MISEKPNNLILCDTGERKDGKIVSAGDFNSAYTDYMIAK
jgi:hypothetical protein